MLWPFALYFSIVIILVAAILIISSLLGERHRERSTGDPYESGIMATGGARGRFDVSFFLIAVFFVIFDLEAIFLFGWAVVVREAGWIGYVEALIFMAVLLAALAYLWRIGGLELKKLQHVIKGTADLRCPRPSEKPSATAWDR